MSLDLTAFFYNALVACAALGLLALGRGRG